MFLSRERAFIARTRSYSRRWKTCGILRETSCVLGSLTDFRESVVLLPLSMGGTASVSFLTLSARARDALIIVLSMSMLKYRIWGVRTERQGRERCTRHLYFFRLLLEYLLLVCILPMLGAAWLFASRVHERKANWCAIGVFHGRTAGSLESIQSDEDRCNRFMTGAFACYLFVRQNSGVYIATPTRTSKNSL